MATQAGIDFEQAGRLWRALGFPPVPDDERVFTHPDVEVLRRIRGLLEEEGADQGVLLQLTRVTGQSLARVAEAQVASSTDLTVLMQADVADEIRPTSSPAASARSCHNWSHCSVTCGAGTCWQPCSVSWPHRPAR